MDCQLRGRRFKSSRFLVHLQRLVNSIEMSTLTVNCQWESESDNETRVNNEITNITHSWLPSPRPTLLCRLALAWHRFAF